MQIPQNEEIAMMLARLVIADKDFAGNLLESAKKAGESMLAGDVENLENWLRIMKAMRNIR